MNKNKINKIKGMVIKVDDDANAEITLNINLNDLISDEVLGKLVSKNLNTLKKEIDAEFNVSNLFTSKFEFINPYNHSQMIGIGNNRFVFEDHLNSQFYSDAFNYKFILKDCKYDDLKVGDFFRYTGRYDWEKENNKIDFGIGLITSIDNDVIHYKYFEDNKFVNFGVNTNLFKDYKFQKVYVYEI